MRLAGPLVVALTLLAGCPRGSGDEGECQVDLECGGDHVCASDHTCLPPGQVRVVRTTWTIRGAPADRAACTGNENLAIRFEGRARGEELRFSPVPCATGLYTILKLPLIYTHVRLGLEFGTTSRVGAIGADGMVAIDLPL